VLRVRHSDFLAAREFAGELELAIAERALQAAQESPRLGGGDDAAQEEPGERTRR
jgi:hypothetical protein